MSPTLILILAAITFPSITFAGKAKKPTCNEFSKGADYKESDAVGTWHLLGPDIAKGHGEAKCVQFSTVDDKERKDLSERIGKYVTNLKFDNLTLKMNIPCVTDKPNKTQLYYLEKQEGVGFYKTLHMPSPTAKLESTDFHRYPMRLKSVFGYLAMMDCHEDFVFLLGKEKHTPGTKLDDRVMQLIKEYWPDEF